MLAAAAVMHVQAPTAVWAVSIGTSLGGLAPCGGGISHSVISFMPSLVMIRTFHWPLWFVGVVENGSKSAECVSSWHARELARTSIEGTD